MEFWEKQITTFDNVAWNVDIPVDGLQSNKHGKNIFICDPHVKSIFDDRD